MFIGEKIYTFETELENKITHFNNIMNNRDSPDIPFGYINYSVAYNEKYIFLLNEQKYIKRDDITLKYFKNYILLINYITDGYDSIQNKMKDLENIKNLKDIFI